MTQAKIKPVFPLDTDLDKLRKTIQDRIDTAPPAIVQAIYVILEQSDKDRIVRDLYKDIASE